MLFANIYFDEIPEIGFAHKHISLNYGANYGNNKTKRIEIAYINSGAVRIKSEDREFLAEKGSVIVLFRHLPLSTETVGDELHSHCTVLAEFSDYEFSVIDGKENPDYGFLIPLIVPPCPEAEEIGRRLYKIAADMAEEREKNALSSSVEFLSVLKKIDEITRQGRPFISSAYTTIRDKVCTYVEDNADKKITLKELAQHIGKSPNHISYAFKCETQKTITQYINEQKAKRMAALMQNHGFSFKEAVDAVGLCDETYGYKVFKRYIGVTPKEYMSIMTIKKL